jgi:hypothetical protein
LAKARTALAVAIDIKDNPAPKLGASVDVMAAPPGRPAGKTIKARATLAEPKPLSICRTTT